jgi:hypothetical protein
MPKDSGGRSKSSSYERDFLTEFEVHTGFVPRFDRETVGLPCRDVREGLHGAQERQVSSGHDRPNLLPFVLVEDRKGEGQSSCRQS